MGSSHRKIKFHQRDRTGWSALEVLAEGKIPSNFPCSFCKYVTFIVDEQNFERTNLRYKKTYET